MVRIRVGYVLLWVLCSGAETTCRDQRVSADSLLVASYMARSLSGARHHLGALEAELIEKRDRLRVTERCGRDPGPLCLLAHFPS